MNRGEGECLCAAVFSAYGLLQSLVDVLENIAITAFSVAGFVSGVRLWWRRQKETGEWWRCEIGVEEIGGNRGVFGGNRRKLGNIMES